jgi:hypothetical protein
LTRRDLRPLVQETLFRTIAVDNSVRDHGRRHTGIHRLLIVLLQRPDLAGKARFLHLHIDPDNLLHVTTSSHTLFPSACSNAENSHLRVLQRLYKSLVDGLDMRLWLRAILPSPGTPRLLRYQFDINSVKALALQHDENNRLPTSGLLLW